MLLRRISKHVGEQNWFAVGIDFVIVVVGVFIGIQVSNWNENQQARIDEHSTLHQLADEFTDIKSGLARQIAARKEWLDDLSLLITTLEGSESREDDPAIKSALHSATGAGRLPPRSPTFMQLTSSGGLTALSNDELKADLVRYDARLHRDAFIHSELVGLITEELSSNTSVDLDVLAAKRVGARMDELQDGTSTVITVRAYDLDGLRKFENRYETIYRYQVLLLTGEEEQLVLTEQILHRISDHAGT